MFDFLSGMMGRGGSLLGMEDLKKKEMLQKALTSASPQAGLSPDMLRQQALQRQGMARQMEQFRPEMGQSQTGLLGQIGGGLQSLGGNEKAMEALGGLGGGSEPQPFVDMLTRGQAPAPMQAPASPMMPQSADPYMQMLMKMIGGAYG